MTLGATDGVLLVAHGTVDDLDDLPEFLTRIRHGRPATAELAAELRRRYEAVGGSPLLEITQAQASELAKALDAPVLVGMRLWRPSVEEAIFGASNLGLSRLVLLPLAPFSVHVYWKAALESLEKVRDQIGPSAPELVSVPAWGENATFVETHAARIAAVLAKPPEDTTDVVLTAHSLPMRAIQGGDSYADQVSACARAIGEKLGRPYKLAYQSQGADGGDWLGPDLQTTLKQCQALGKRDIVVSPFGFLADHIETLYDLDVEANSVARALGLTLRRLPAMNVEPGFIAALAQISRQALTSPVRSRAG